MNPTPQVVVMDAAAIFKELAEIKKMITSSFDDKAQPVQMNNSNDWLTANRFQQANNMGRTRFKRLLNEGHIDKREAGDYKRYRWAK